PRGRRRRGRMAPLRRRGACERRSAPSRRRLHDHAGLASRPEEKLTMEIADGIHRIESDLGERSMCQYALVGRERVLLIDTGLAETPGEVIDPYLERLAVEPDLVLISHADVDHSGGNRAFPGRPPPAVLVCHDGIYDRKGTKLIPPRYYALRGLRETIGRLQALRPELLLTAHYPVLEGADGLDWLETGRAFVDDVERVVRRAMAEGTTDLW